MTSSMIENTAYIQLLNRVAVTREARFAAKKRLKRRHKRAYYIISLLSLFVIITSTIPNIWDLDHQQSQVLLAITILNSVFIIITTLMDAAGDYSLQAHLMQVSGRRLSVVFNGLLLATDEQKTDSSWVERKQTDYQCILDDCPFDHEDVDYLAVRVKKPALFAHENLNRSTPIMQTLRIVDAIRLHYLRARWWIPHTIMVFLSIAIMIRFA